VASAALWITGAVLLVGFCLLSSLQEEDSARFAGYFVGSLLFPLAIAALIRWAVTRGNPHERIWSPWLLLIAAGVAFLPALARIGDAASEAQSAAECRENTNPEGRFQALPPGMAAETLDAETEAQMNQLFSDAEKQTGGEAFVRRVSRGGEPVAVAVVITLGDDSDARAGFLRGFTGRATERGAGPARDVSLGKAEEGKEVALPDAQGGGVIVAGFAGCHAIGVYAIDSPIARRVVTSMGAAPES
jgi:hypothetical protein